MDYNFNEHKHRFAVWTAARAAQRSFTTTTNICKAINASSLRNFAESGEPVTQTEFDLLHVEWCKSIMSSLGEIDVICSYGRAAKIIAIYLKTSVILPAAGNTKKCFVIHPLIDAILLKSLLKEEGLKDLRNRTWTKFNEAEYLAVVNVLRNRFSRFDWRLEVNWKPEEDEVGLALLP